MDPENELNPAESTTETVQEISPSDAVLEDLGLGESTTPDGDTDHAGETPDGSTPPADTDPDKPADPEKAPEGDKPKEPDAEKNKITDADLEPLAVGNKATQERFKKVTEGYKEERQRADTLAEENSRYKESFDALRGLGFTDEAAAEDLVALSGYRHVLATGDAEAFSKIISEQIREFESVHGKKISIQASALDNYPDLKDKIDNLELDEETALELARSRSIQQRAQRDLQAQNEERVKTQTSQQEIDGAVSAIEDMQANWKKLDPDYAAILPHLKEQMPEIGKQYPAHMWPSIIDMQYKTLKRALVAASTNKPNTQPIRGNGRMATQAAPKNPTDAALMEMGFEVDSE